MAAATLALSGAIAIWQWGPLPDAMASPPVDEKIVSTSGAPASFADVIEAVKPAVVNISVTASMAHQPFAGPMPGNPLQPNMPFEEFLRRFFERQSFQKSQGGAPPVRGMGSGFIVDADGYVVTNHHVIEHAEEIQVILNDGERYDAELVGSDSKTDLAVLKIDADEPLPFARFGDSDSTRIGDWVIAIGNPFGLGGTATTGIVSARGRDIHSGPFDDFLQIDAPINQGNSGGPLFDLSGRVIGINTAIYSPNGGNVGIGFAIPAKQATPIIEQLKTSGRIERAWLGVQIQAVTDEIAEGLGLDESRGALVASVVAGSPAEKAGLRAGDVILGFNGEDIDNVKDLTRRVAAASTEDESTIEIWRSGDRETLNVDLGRSPEDNAVVAGGGASPDAGAPLGMSLAELGPQTRQRYRVDESVQGALIVDVAPNSPAARMGLRRGDVVTMVGQTTVSGAGEAAEEIKKASDDDRPSVLLQVARGDDRQFVAVPFA
jgi:serine protease Do